MAYVPPKKQKHTREIVLGCIVLAVVFGAVWGYRRYNHHASSKEEPFTICGLDVEQTAEKLQSKEKDSYMISDYLFYGESLNLFAKDYEAGTKNAAPDGRKCQGDGNKRVYSCSRRWGSRS